MARRPTPKAIQKLLASAGDRVAQRLPLRWQVAVAARTVDGGIIRFTPPVGEPIEIRAYVDRRRDPRRAAALPTFDEPTIVVSDWLSPRTRTILDETDRSYADTTGNISLSIDAPLIAIRSQGADRTPSPPPRVRSSLR